MATPFNMAVTNVALPTLAAELDASGLQIHLSGDGFTITLTALVLLLQARSAKTGNLGLSTSTGPARPEN